MLDDEKHYWVGEAELTKLFDAGAGWLDEHPRREQIARRYLRRDRRMVSEALRRLTDDEEPGCAEHDANAPRREVALERPIGLNERRYATFRMDTRRASGLVPSRRRTSRLHRALRADR